MKRNIGYFVVFALLGLILLGAFAETRVLWTGSRVDTLQLLGCFLGVVALATMLLAGLLSVRVPGWDRPFGGLTRLWKLHHYLGAASLAAVFLHVMFIGLAATASSVQSAVSLLFPTWGGMAIWVGWAALLTMLVFLVPSFQFFGRPDYRRWKWIHRFAAPAALLALLHAWWLTRSFSTMAAGVIWGGLGALVLLAFIYRFFFGRRLAIKGVVTANEPLARGVVEITVGNLNRPLVYQPGQWVYLTHYDTTREGCGEEHPFSIVSTPSVTELKFGIKAAGDATTAMQTLPIGTKMVIDGPYGDFFHTADAVPALWIAGGIGIAPFIGKARALAENPPEGLDVVAIYCAENIERSYYHEELIEIAGRTAGFNPVLHLFVDEGFLSTDFLQKHCPDAATRQAFVCGPQGLMDHAHGLLRQLGMPRRLIETEEFDLL